MKKPIRYKIFDPAGNITIIVLSQVKRSDYQTVSGVLLKLHPEAEQVGFVVEDEEGRRLEMSGLEFCGNASRAFAYYEASLDESSDEEFKIRVSGCDETLRARVDIRSNEAMVEMPVPRKLVDVEIPYACGNEMPRKICGRLVIMDGIGHLVLRHEKAVKGIFEYIRDYIYSGSAVDKEGDRIPDLPAFGVMFIGEAEEGSAPDEYDMTPVVYVRDVNTVYFEGSCGSGSVAAACALAYDKNSDKNDGISNEFSFRQPKGTLRVDIEVSDHSITGLWLCGDVTMSGDMETEVGL